MVDAATAFLTVALYWGDWSFGWQSYREVNNRGVQNWSSCNGGDPDIACGLDRVQVLEMENWKNIPC
jgi:hypothetical protein